MDRKELRRRWEKLHNDPNARKLLRSEVADSWERSYQYGVDPMMRRNPYVATEAERREALEKCDHLIQVARPVMEQLYEFVAGTGFIVALSDTGHQGLEFFGDHESIEWAKSVHLEVGGLWSEKLVGTNCTTLSLIMAKPLSLFGYEHFCLFGHAGAASAAPIFDGGKIIGALSMMGPYNRVSNHTLGMIVGAVNHIQSNIIQERASKFHQSAIDSISEGLLVVKGDGEILSANNVCSKILRATGYPIVGRNLYDLIGDGHDNRHFINLVTRGKTITDETVTLFFDRDRVQCNITCSPMEEHDCFSVILRESHKVNRLVRNWIGGNAKVTFDDIVSRDPKFKQALDSARAASSSDSNVLITGESGTGKDLVAQAMHNASPRRNHPFVAINCAALPRDLIASELFGYEDGAFTGARKGGNIGKFELADNGTLFLDEIGDMPLDLQAALLRVLEEKSIMRLGGNKFIPVNVRIIAATNKNLDLEMERKTFRNDLYYRLGVIRLNISPLRERKKDIPALLEYFLSKTCEKLNRPIVHPAPEILDVFMSYSWPGNVREMQNIIECAIQLSQSDEIDFHIIRNNLRSFQAVAPPIPVEETVLPGEWSLEKLEKRAILECLKKHNNNKSDTARALGIQRKTLYNRLKQYGVD